MKRTKPITFPEKYRKELEQMITGDHSTALAAKQRLAGLATKHYKQGQLEEAKLIKRIYKRVRI